MEILHSLNFADIESAPDNCFDEVCYPSDSQQN